MTLAARVAPASARSKQAAVRVMVVDDAVVIRGLLSRWIEQEPGLELVASLRNGREAVDALATADPDVVVLDIDMPELDGLAALPLLLEQRRDLVVIMASTLTRHNAEMSLKALSLGALDYIPKPDTIRGVTTSQTFRRELVEKISTLGRRRRSAAAPAARIPSAPLAPVEFVEPADAAQSLLDYPLAPFSQAFPRAVLIGSSTGGPQALCSLVPQLGNVIGRVPVLIAQHMPPTFTAILAEHLTRLGRHPAHEAVHGEPIVRGNVYVAPGGRHMRVARRDGVPVIELDDGAPVQFCKPAVDPLLSSAAEVWGNAALAIILTGMGQDGAAGAKRIAAAGGSVIAQDQMTSVVWGMPKAAARAGACAAILPLEQIGPKIARLVCGDRA